MGYNPYDPSTYPGPYNGPAGASFSGNPGPPGSGNFLNALTGTGPDDPSNPVRQAEMGIGHAGYGLGYGGAQNYQNANTQLGGVNTYLQGLMRGQNSVSAEQLRQGLMQNQAAQQSMAAGAAPMNQAMAARNAANNMASLGYGMSGQQAVAGLQERNQAANQLSQNYLGMGNMGINAANAGYGAANNAYGNQLGHPQQSLTSALLPAAQAAGTVATMSDRNVKHDIAEDDDSARKLREGLKAYTYKYNDPKHGEGKRIGIMAQDLEKAGSKAVFQTKEGKAVNGAVLSTENTAMIVELGKRLAAVEAKR